MQQHEALFIPVNAAPYFVTANSAKELDEMQNAPPLAFVGMYREMIILDDQSYDRDEPENGGLLPWELPGLTQDDIEEEDAADPNAYGRREVENWDDMLYVWVNENARGLRLPVNQNLKHLCTKSGDQILGNAVLVRHLEESGCGDYVSNLPIPPSRLAELGLKDPRAAANREA